MVLGTLPSLTAAAPRSSVSATQGRRASPWPALREEFSATNRENASRTGSVRRERTTDTAARKLLETTQLVMTAGSTFHFLIRIVSHTNQNSNIFRR